MLKIKVIQQSTQERKIEQELKYQEFLKYYFETDLRVKEIFKLCGFTSNNSTVKYIRSRMKADGYNSLSRFQSIRKGEWLK